MALPVFAGMALPAPAADKLVLSTGVLAPYTTPDHKGFLDLLVPAVFQELGVDAELLAYPAASERALLNANEGIDDGLAMRIEGLERQYPGLVRVPEELVSNDFVAIATRHRFATPGYDALKPYVVSYIIGWKIFEANVPGVQELTLVRDADQMFTLLEKGRADVVLYERWQGLAASRARGLKVQVMEPPLARTRMFMYLHRKHAALVPRAAEALVRLKRNGTYQRLYDSVFKPLARQSP